jgi:hypothetical protein
MTTRTFQINANLSPRRSLSTALEFVTVAACLVLTLAFVAELVSPAVQAAPPQKASIARRSHPCISIVD